MQIYVKCLYLISNSLLSGPVTVNIIFDEPIIDITDGLNSFFSLVNSYGSHISSIGRVAILAVVFHY